MKRKERLLALVVLLLLVGAMKLGQQLYRWVAYSEERAEIAVLLAQLEVAGLGVIDTQVGADTLRRAIDAIDVALGVSGVRVGRNERSPVEQASPGTPERWVRGDIATRGATVDERNELFGAWQETIGSNRVHVERYNLLADSIRTVAERMGEPFYPISTPAEIAERRGFLQERRDSM